VTCDVNRSPKSLLPLQRLSPNDSAPVREPLLEPGKARRNERLTSNGSFKGESGFTLLELIIVMILSLMILGLVSVYFANFLSSARLQATVREFSAT
jgi:prepilin-type N-terminal cleavage/methylation domain-containing protein